MTKTTFNKEGAMGSVGMECRSEYSGNRALAASALTCITQKQPIRRKYEK